MMSLLEPCDVVLFKSYGKLSKVIRFFTRNIGESKTIASHSAIVVEAGVELDAIVVESNLKTQRRSLKESSESVEICVFRPINLTAGEMKLIVAAAEKFVGRSYGFLKLTLHMGDWFLNGAYVFRRLGRLDKYPICSYSVASAFAAAGKDFGIPRFGASPDDIWDFCLGNPDKYRFVWQNGQMLPNPQPSLK